MNYSVRNSRYARQNFAELLDSAAVGARIGIDRNGQIAAAVVSPAALSFIESVEAAETVEQLLAALALREADGKQAFVRPGLVASLAFAVRERQPGPRGIMELPRAVETRRDGKVVHIGFGDDHLIKNGWIVLNIDGCGQHSLSGFISVVPLAPALALELSNGQRLESFEQNGTNLSFQNVLIDSDVELENTKIIQQPSDRAGSTVNDSAG